MQFPESKVRSVAGFSEKIMEIMPLLENDPQAMVNAVKKYDFSEKEEAETA